MTGVDTNVLLRFFLSDNAEQAAAARNLVEKAYEASDALMVQPVVVAELVWVLRRRYRYDRGQIAWAIRSLLDTDGLELAERAVIAEALAGFQTSHVDFADVMIGRLNQRRGCTSTYTFDRKAAALGDFTLLNIH